MEKTMSIHRGLAELKTLDKRIQRAANEPFVSYRIGQEPPRGFKDSASFEEAVQSNFQSVTQLIKNRNDIKAAITASNAANYVTIAGVKMTVAEAIDRRDTGIAYDKVLLTNLRRQLTQVEQMVDSELRLMEPRLDKRIDSDLGSKDRKDNAEEVENITEAFLKRYKPSVADPIDLRKTIKDLEESIEQFEMEVDFSLSEANTENKIVITD